MSFSDLRLVRIQASSDPVTVELMDGRVLSAPLVYYPTLLHASEAQRKNCQPIGAGYGIEVSRTCVIWAILLDVLMKTVLDQAGHRIFA